MLNLTTLFRAISAKRFGLVAFIVPFISFVLTLNGVWSTDYPASILGLQYSLWVNHTFSLGTSGHTIVNSVDAGMFNGNTYSEISPGFAIVSLPFAALGIFLDGNAFSVFGNLLLCDELFLALASAIGSYFVYKMCRFYAGPRASVLAGLTFALATPLWPISTVVFIHGASVMFSTGSTYLLLRHVKVTGKTRDLIASGICLGLAAFIEYMAALLVIPLMAYLLINRRGFRSLAFLLPSSVGPTLWFVTNYLAFSNPLIFPEQLKSGPVLGQFNISLIAMHAAWYIISPYRGILVFSPVVALGIFQLYKMSRSRELREDAFLFLSMFALVLVGYSAWSDWAGGLAYGPRFLLLGLAYLVVPISIFLERGPFRERTAFYLLFVASFLIEGLGVFTTAFSNAGDELTYQLYSLNLPWFILGKFDTWWFGRMNVVPPFSQIIAVVFFGCIASYAFYLLAKLPIKSAMEFSTRNFKDQLPSKSICKISKDPREKPACSEQERKQNPRGFVRR